METFQLSTHKKIQKHFNFRKHFNICAKTFHEIFQFTIFQFEKHLNFTKTLYFMKKFHSPLNPAHPLQTPVPFHRPFPASVSQKTAYSKTQSGLHPHVVQPPEHPVNVYFPPNFPQFLDFVPVFGVFACVNFDCLFCAIC